MKLSEIYKIANEIAPKALSDEYCAKYGAYDNSGVLVDTGDDISSVLCSLDLSNGAIEKAIAQNARLIITHHPAIYGKIDDVCVSDALGEKLITCIKKGISVLSMHLNLDCAVGGIDESLAQGVWIAAGRASANKAEQTGETAFHHATSQGGYGRAYAVPVTALDVFARELQKEFSCAHIWTYGEKDKKICRVASFCGAGVDEAAIDFAKQQNADVIISSDFKHHQIALALERGLAVVIPSHYAAENYGFKKYYEKIRRRLDIPCGYHTDEILL